MQLNELYCQYGDLFRKSPEFCSIWKDNPNFKFVDNRVTAKSGLIRSLVVSSLQELFEISDCPADINFLVMKSYNESLYKYFLTNNEQIVFSLEFKTDVIRREHDFISYGHPRIKFTNCINFVTLTKAVVVDEYKSYILYTLIGRYGTKQQQTEYFKMSYYVYDDIFHLVPPRIKESKESVILTVNLKQLNSMIDIKKILDFSISQRLFRMFHQNNCNKIFGENVVTALNFNKGHHDIFKDFEKYGVDVHKFGVAMKKISPDYFNMNFVDVSFSKKTIPNFIELYEMSLI